jgi:hypothetical protein
MNRIPRLLHACELGPMRDLVTLNGTLVGLIETHVRSECAMLCGLTMCDCVQQSARNAHVTNLQVGCQAQRTRKRRNPNPAIAREFLGYWMCQQEIDAEETQLEGMCIKILLSEVRQIWANMTLWNCRGRSAKRR